MSDSREFVPRREEGRRCQLSCKVRELVCTHTETATVVKLANYESINHCASCDDPDHGFLQTSAFSTGLGNGYYS